MVEPEKLKYCIYFDGNPEGNHKDEILASYEEEWLSLHEHPDISDMTKNGILEEWIESFGIPTSLINVFFMHYCQWTSNVNAKEFMMWFENVRKRKFYVDCWHFDDSDIDFVAELMVRNLSSYEDKETISVLGVLCDTLNAEYIEPILHNPGIGTPIRIKDIKISDNKYLHDYIKWDFKYGVWAADHQDGMKLFYKFQQKVNNAGYEIKPKYKGKIGAAYSMSLILTTYV